MKKFLAVLLSASLLFSSVSPAMARDHDRNNRDDHGSHNWNQPSRGYGYNNRWDHDDHRRGHNNNGLGIALGVLAGVAVLAAADSHPAYVQQPVYVALQPTHIQHRYVEKTYVPVTVQHTVYQPQYREVSEWVPAYY